MAMKGLRNIWRNEQGSIPIEGLYGSLLLLGWFIVAFQVYDAFRSRSMALRASYTVGDLISRERDAIGPKYVTGLKKVFDYMTHVPNSNYTWLRVTLISCTATNTDTNECDGTAKKFTLDASYTTAASGVAVHTATSINNEKSRIPVLAAGDSAVILESSMRYYPLFVIGDRAMTLDGKTWSTIGLSNKMRFSNFVVTRPRGPRTVWNSAN
jgi:hypothetical protein